MRTLFKSVLTLFALVYLSACRELYEPEVNQLDQRVLVVEGYLDSEGLKSELRISKTSDLGVDSSPSPELGALVELISSSGITYPLVEEGDGLYVFQKDILEENTYQLSIRLSNGEQVLSDPIQPILTPPILEAGFVKDESGIEVFVNTQGDENADDFLWTYEETWIFLPRVRVTFIYKPGEGVVNRNDDERIDLCYKTERNAGVLLETSSRFEDQVVFRQTIKEFEEGDPRMQKRYSILVSQKAIPQEAVEFWETLKRNSEDIGTVFSPLPSLIGGNLHFVENQNRPVVGQVGIGVVQQSRIFIDREEILPWEIFTPEFDDCFIGTDTIRTSMYGQTFSSGAVLPARVVPGPMGPLGYFTTARRCADCTLYAEREKPDFWID